MHAKMSMPLLSLFLAIWAFSPVAYSHAGMASDAGFQLAAVEQRQETVESSSMSPDRDSGVTEERTYKKETTENIERAPVSPPPVVHEYDRETVVPEPVPVKPPEGRVQSWWHRNFHRDTD